MDWIEIKAKGLPKDSDNETIFLFAQYYWKWKQFTNSDLGTWSYIKDHRDYDLKNSYTHYIKIPIIK